MSIEARIVRLRKCRLGRGNYACEHGGKRPTCDAHRNLSHRNTGHVSILDRENRGNARRIAFVFNDPRLRQICVDSPSGSTTITGNATHALTIPTRRLAHRLPECARETGLAGDPQRQRNIGQRPVTLRQQSPRVVKAPQGDIAMGGVPWLV